MLLAEVQKLDTPDVEFSALAPVLLLIGGAVLLLVIGSLLPRRSQAPWHATFTIVTAGASIISALVLWFDVRDEGAVHAIGDTVRVDGLTVFLAVVIASGVLLTALLADGYLRRERLEGPEAYVLLMLSASGGILMASANDLVVLFLGLEILSIAVYVLAGIHIRRARSGEAAMKYFVLGAFSSAFLLYGIALVYGATGSTNLTVIQSFLARNVLTNDVGLLAGFAMLLVGLGFKVAAVPFHAWAPDVYDGAPSPIVAYMASAVKAAGFAALIRIFVYGFGNFQADWRPIVAVLAVLTLVVGSVLAVVQTNVKRLLAYSSISHAGFILLGVDAATEKGVAATLFYLATYTFTVAGSFGIATVIGRTGDNAHAIDDYRGLAKRSPFLAFTFLVFLIAQAGVPLTSGFVAKFAALGAAIDAGRWWLALIGMLASVISAYAYLRVVLAMYGEDSEDDAPKRYTVPVGARIAIGGAAAVTLVLGFYPSPLLQASRTAAEIDATPVATAPPTP